ncbi:DUF21 domain-containing protein [Pseudactinotalea sp. HY160]|uniref:hemolysin family protein n=1 Tax=Pseudactinotalea sp. HY160 TaxID=2654490 RepID=UPI00128D9111|nr:hemolysin family protein [Pseudactinotalea sp. HY160]MPV48899.1 DUF21 domain-containing protein [Pseudactinotalea sp. HY160]
MVVDWLLILLGLALTAGTFVFVAAEFSLVALDPAAVEGRIAAGDKRAVGVSRALKQLSTQLSGAQVGITLTTILLGYTMQKALANVLGAGLTLSGLAQGVAAAVAVVLSLVLVNALSMLFGELIPKNWAIAEPMRVAILVSPLQRGFTRVFAPIITVLNSSANVLLRRFGVEPKEELSGARSAPELASLVRHSAAAGTLDAGTASLLTRSIALGDLSAVDVMTDRMRMISLRRDESAQGLIGLARSSGHSRFPVIGENPDEIVGLVHLRRAIAVPYDRRTEVPVAALMDPAPSVPETMPIGHLLLELRAQGMQMAVVVDEYGGTSGVVTLEDVVEEIVGEVADEHDRRHRPVRPTGPDTWVVPGTLRPDELRSHTNVRVPDEAPYETIGGLIITALGRLPERGDEVELPGVCLRVMEMDGRRVDLVQVRAEGSRGDE